jgi:AcrR family transcriptional regulator
MPRTTDARDRAIETTILLLRRQGYEASGLSQILAESGAPKGSFYFHFPQGKEQLALEALQVYGASVKQSIESTAAQTKGDPAAFIKVICTALASEMERSHWQLGCAVQNVANEMPSEAFRETVSAILADWRRALAKGLAGKPERASAREASAAAFLAALEGARTLARVERSSRIFDEIADLFVARCFERS